MIGIRFHCWYVEYTGPGNEPYCIVYCYSEDGINWSEPAVVSLELHGFTPWHINIIRIDENYEMLLTAYSIGSTNAHTLLFHASSTDGLHWLLSNPEPVLKPGVNSWDDREIYRASMVRDHEGYKIWYSAADATGRWGGEADIIADNVNVLSKTQITCSFDLKNKPVGAWDVMIINKHKFLFFKIDKPTILPDGFTIKYPEPTVSGINPKQSLNNSQCNVTITGTSFHSGAAVMLTNGQMDIGATNIQTILNSSLSRNFNLTGVTAGVYNVKIVNMDSRAGLLANGYTVVSSSATAPVISEISPKKGFNNGVVMATLTGSNFSKNISVKLQGENQLTI